MFHIIEKNEEGNVGYIFELQHQQQLILYAERNQIIEVRLPLRKGGEYVLRNGYLSDLSAVLYKGMLRMVWHSLEHNIILSGEEEESDRIILSDAMYVRQFGALHLEVRNEQLYLFYSALEPVSQKWQAYMQRLEESQEEPVRIPGMWEKRPIIEPSVIGDQWILKIGVPGRKELRCWEEGFPVYEEKITGHYRKLLADKDTQIQYISHQYEELRKIAVELQEDGKKMREYIQNQQKGHRSKSNAHKI